MEVLQLRSDEGPCVECFRTATRSVGDPPITRRWPRVAAAFADRAAFPSIEALPLRLRESRSERSI